MPTARSAGVTTIADVSLAAAEPAILANVRTLRKLIEISAYPDYEALLELQYRKLIGPGDAVVDIGAHTGRQLGGVRRTGRELAEARWSRSSRSLDVRPLVAGLGAIPR